MKRRRLSSLFLIVTLLTLLIPKFVDSTVYNVFNCSTIPSPQSGVDYCFEGSTNSLKNYVSGVWTNMLGTGYNRIQLNGVNLPQEVIVNFKGAGVTCADVTGKTECTFSGGGGGSSSQHQVGGVNLLANDPINFIPTSTIGITNPTAGNVQFSVLAIGNAQIAANSVDPTKIVGTAVTQALQINTAGLLTGGGSLTGNLTIAMANQVAGCVVAGPASGGSAAPTCRPLVDTDIPLVIARSAAINVQGTTNEIASTGNGVSPTLSIPANFRIGNKTSTAPIKSGTILPTACANDVNGMDVFIKTDSLPAGLYGCIVGGNPGKWSLLGDGGTSGGTGSQHQVNGVNVLTNDPINFLSTGTVAASNPSAGSISLTIVPSSVGNTQIASAALSPDRISGTAVVQSLTVGTSAPLTGGGALSSNLNIGMALQNANCILSGPTSGGSATPTCRPLVAADIPNGIVDLSTKTTGVLARSSLPATTVFNDASAAFTGGGLQDYTNALVKVPNAVGYTPTLHGHLGINNTDNTVRIGINGVNNKIFTVGSAVSFANLIDLANLAHTNGLIYGANGNNVIAWTVTDCQNGMTTVNLAAKTIGCTAPGGGGGGTVTGSGTAGRFAQWTAVGAVGNSSFVTETAGTGITIAGTTCLGTCGTNDWKPNYANIVGHIIRNMKSVNGDEVVSLGTLTQGHLSAIGSGGIVVDGGQTEITGGINRDSGLLDTDDRKKIYPNTGGTKTITQIKCWTDTGTSTVNFQRDDGTPANILSSNLVCSTSGATSTTFVSGENVIANGQNIDLVMVTAATSGTPTQVTWAILVNR